MLLGMNQYLIKRAELERMPESVVRHQFNDNAVRHTKTVSSLMGLSRLGLHWVRIEPGHDSTAHHCHEADEEFIYILSGSGTARINDEYFAVGAGDIMAFPAPGAAHSLHNSGDTDLVYLVGGERHLPDVVHYPVLERSMVKTQKRRSYADWQDIREAPPR